MTMFAEPGDILLPDFSEHVRKLHMNNNKLFLKEYEVNVVFFNFTLTTVH